VRSFAELARHQLENGVHVVLDPHGTAPLVTVAISVSVGSRDQPRGWTGLAHLAEHLMFRARPSQPVHFIDRVERLGATAMNGMTERDRTVYYETVPSGALDEVLWLEADRFANVLSELDAEAVGREREIVLRERAIREANRRIGPSLIDRELYPGDHPYADAQTERDSDLGAIGLSEMRSFFQRAYVPSHLTIVVSGQFDRERTLSRVTDLFGRLRAAAPALEPPAAQLPVLDGERRLLIDVPRGTDQLTVLWPTPPYGTPDDAALDVVGRLLERDIQHLLDRHGLSVFARQTSADVSSDFVVVVEVPRRFGTQIPRDAIDQALAVRQARPPTPTEIERARLELFQVIASAASSRTNRALMLSRRPASFASGFYDPVADMARYDALDPSTILAAFRTWLPIGRRLLVSLNASARAPYEGRLVTRVVVR
jgi:zinc protease